MTSSSSHSASAPAAGGPPGKLHVRGNYQAAAGDVCPDALAAACDAAADGTPSHAFCPRFHHAVELIGRRWTGVVLRAMLRGATRFCDIRAAVPALSDKMLVERLKELETEGVVTRTVVPSTPVRVEYYLTEKGRDLEAVMEAFAGWVSRWVSSSGERAG